MSSRFCTRAAAAALAVLLLAGASMVSGADTGREDEPPPAPSEQPAPEAGEPLPQPAQPATGDRPDSPPGPREPPPSPPPGPGSTPGQVPPPPLPPTADEPRAPGAPPPVSPDKQRWWDMDLSLPADAPVCTCACEVEIRGPDRFTRHWKNPDWYRPGGTNEVCFQALTRWRCPEGARTGSTDCRFKWLVPEWNGRITGPYVADTLCFNAPPPAVIKQLKEKGEYRLALRAEASCSYHCYAGEELYTRSTKCTGNRTVIVSACATDEDEEKAKAECEALKTEAATLLEQVPDALQQAQNRRQNLEAAVQVYGGMIPIACQGLEAAGADCAWASVLEAINIGLSSAGAIASAIGGLATAGLAVELEGAVQSLTLALAANAEDSWDTEQCDQLMNTLRNNLIEYKIKACEHAKGFREVCRELDDFIGKLEALLSKAKHFSACRYCDLDDLLKKLNAALDTLRAEAQTCHGAAKKYGAWIDYCEGDSQYTTGTAEQICADAPPLP